MAKRDLKKVHETVKLFFRKRMEKLELVLFTFPPNLLIVAAHEEAKELNHELLFIDMQKVVVPPKEELEEEAKNRMSRAEEVSKRAGFDAMLETVQNEAIANWVLKRITLGKKGRARSVSNASTQTSTRATRRFLILGSANMSRARNRGSKLTWTHSWATSARCSSRARKADERRLPRAVCRNSSPWRSTRSSPL